MEESQYRFHRLRDDVTHYLAATPADRADAAKVEEVFREHQSTWDR